MMSHVQLITRPPMKRLDGEVTILTELAGSHNGDIWLGEWFGKEKVVLKLVPEIRATDSRVMKRCEREFITRKSLQNDHILPLYGIVTDPQHHIYMVSPWQTNGSILEYVKSHPTANKIHLLLGAARGLHYLHVLGFVHGHVKCSNILVSSDGGALLSGFRLTELMEDVTSSEGVLAKHSARWLAPELIERTISSPTVHSDTYSFAMAMLELLSEKHPFANLTQESTVIHEVTAKKTPLRPPADKLTPWLTDQLWALMQECWHYEPTSRPDMTEVASRLQEFEFAIFANRPVEFHERTKEPQNSAPAVFHPMQLFDIIRRMRLRRQVDFSKNTSLQPSTSSLGKLVTAASGSKRDSNHDPKSRGTSSPIMAMTEVVASPLDHRCIHTSPVTAYCHSCSTSSVNHFSHKYIDSRDPPPVLHRKAHSSLIDGAYPIVYQNLLSVIVQALDAKEGSSSTITDTLENVLQPMRNLDAVSSLAYSQRYCRQLLEVASKLGVDAATTHRAVSEDEPILYQTALKILNSYEDRLAVMRLQGDDADRFMSIMDKIIMSESSVANDATTRLWHRLLVQLSLASGILPSSLYIQGVTDIHNGAVYGGGFADVYRARLHGQEVALKRIRLFQDQDRQKFYRRLCREALIWRRLDHPYVLPFLGVDPVTFPGLFCLISPWMRYGTLVRYLEGPDALDANFNQLLYQIARGVGYLHAQHIVHGDLRGTNILIDDQRRARIGDFGLVAFDEVVHRSHSSARQGSLRWMAPELHYPESLGFTTFQRTCASDVYSYACVCLEVYSGHPPFSEINNNSTVVFRVVGGSRPKRPSKGSRRPMSDGMWQLVESCWRSQPSERPTMAEVILMLQEGDFGVV